MRSYVTWYAYVSGSTCFLRVFSYKVRTASVSSHTRQLSFWFVRRRCHHTHDNCRIGSYAVGVITHTTIFHVIIHVNLYGVGVFTHTTIFYVNFHACLYSVNIVTHTTIHRTLYKRIDVRSTSNDDCNVVDGNVRRCHVSIATSSYR
jgi:hypothetical protein